MKAVKIVDDLVVIYPWKEGMCDSLEIEWKDGEGWDDIKKKYSDQDGIGACLWGKFAGYYFEEGEYIYNEFEYEFPFSVSFYEFGDKIIISYSEIQEFDDIKHCCCIPYNRLIMGQFMKEELAPLSDTFQVRRVLNDEEYRNALEEDQMKEAEERRKRRNRSEASV